MAAEAQHKIQLALERTLETLEKEKVRPLMVSQGAIGVAIKYSFHIIYDREVRKKLKVFQKSKMIALCMISRDHLKALFKREDFKMGSFLKFDQVVPEIHEFQYSKKGGFFKTRLLRGNFWSAGGVWQHIKSIFGGFSCNCRYY